MAYLKNKKLSIFILFTVVIGFGLLKGYDFFMKYCHKIEEHYKKEYRVLDERSSIWYCLHFELFIRDSLRLPIDIDEMYIEGLDTRDWFDECIHNSLADHLSPGYEGNLLYIPLYDTNKLIVAAALLSVGVDQKMNTIIKRSDTVYIDSFLKQVQVYNPIDFRSILLETTVRQNFSFFDYWFGKKDYLAMVITPFKVNDGIYLYDNNKDFEVVSNFKDPDQHIIYLQKEGNEILERILNSGKNKK